jgi:hypothetical protein
MLCIWSLLNDNNNNTNDNNNNNDNNNTNDNNNKLIIFFTILLEVSIPDNKDDDEIMKVASLFTKMVIAYTKNKKTTTQIYYDTTNDTTTNDDSNIIISIDDLIGWSHDYAPFIPKLLETVMTNAFFSSILQPSYKPFYPVILADKSDIVSPQLLLPLAMYSSLCQGQWKKLYTTQTDGWAFNRIAHHILGYAGPTCIIFKTVIDRVPHIF